MRTLSNAAGGSVKTVTYIAESYRGYQVGVRCRHYTLDGGDHFLIQYNGCWRLHNGDDVLWWVTTLQQYSEDEAIAAARHAIDFLLLQQAEEFIMGRSMTTAEIFQFADTLTPQDGKPWLPSEVVRI